MIARSLVVVLLIAPAFAGCAAPTPAAVIDGFGPYVPRCVGACALPVDDSPARAWEPFITIDPGDPDHLVVAHTEWVDGGFTTTRVRVSVSEDGGATWATRVVPSGLDVGPDHPLAPYESAGWDCVMVFLPDGSIAMSAIALNLVPTPAGVLWVFGQTVYTTRSVDGGHSWGDVRIVDRGDGVAFPTPAGPVAWKYNGQPRLTSAPDGTLLLVWTQFTQKHPDSGFTRETHGRLVFSTSADGGLTWAPAGVIEEEGLPFLASPIVGADGTWRVAYADISDGELRFAQSGDDGATWDARAIGTTSYMPDLRSESLDSGVERLLLAYSTGDDGRYGENQVELRWSDDGGTTWDEPFVLDTPEGLGAPMPLVVGAPGDRAWVTYFDARHGEPVRYLAREVGSGVAGAPLVLDEVDAEAQLLGDYMGLTAAPNGDALAAWVTYGDGEFDVVWARLARGDARTVGVEAAPSPPAGLDEPVEYEFTGHLDVPDCVVEAPPGLGSVEHEFDVPAGTRYLNGTLEWAMRGPTPETSDLDLILYDPDGGSYDAATLDVPEVFSFEILAGKEGTWIAWIQNCQNPPTDFTLSLELS